MSTPFGSSCMHFIREVAVINKIFVINKDSYFRNGGAIEANLDVF